MLPTDSLRPLTAIYVDSMISLDSMTLVIRVLSAAWCLYFEKNFKMEFELGCQRDIHAGIIYQGHDFSWLLET